MNLNFLNKYFLILIPGFFLLASCVSRQDIRAIQTDLYNIQQGIESKIGSVEDQTSTVQTTQADLQLDVDELSENIAALKTELEYSRSRVTELGGRLDDLEASLTTRMDAQIELLSGSKFSEKPLPSTVYNLANADFVRGRNTEAIKGFKNYITKFPKGQKVPEAYLNIGQAYSKKKVWSKSIDTFNDLIEKYPKHALVPTAMLKKGDAYTNWNKQSVAKTVYRKIVQKYPYRPEARAAQEKLNEWRSQ